MSRTSQLGRLPAVDDVLRRPELVDLTRTRPRRHVVDWVRRAIADGRQELLSGNHYSEEELLNRVLDRVQQLHDADLRRSLQPVINATGVLLHTNLGRAPLAPRAVQRMQQAARYTNLELDLATGKRGRRGDRAAQLLAQLVGAEQALVVNNCAAATILALRAVAAEREVIVSRGQLVEIGGGFRLPDVFREAGVTLREVGTTNRTYVHDYERQCGEDTAAVIRVHRSNFVQSGFTCEPSTAELAAVSWPAGVALIDDLGSGCVTDLSILGFSESTVQDSLRSGAHLCLFSGDKLLGGPQCGLIAGRSDWVDRLRQHPLMRALRPDKLTLAALEATLEIHLAETTQQELPLYQMLHESVEQLRTRGQRLIEQCHQLTVDVQLIDCCSQVGGGTLPGVELASCGVAVRGISIDRLASQLRNASIAVQPRQQDDQLLLDLRTVLPDQIQQLGDSLVASIAAAATT